MVELTRYDIESREKPIIVATVLHPVGANDAPNLKVELRNAGRGPALNLKVQAGWREQDGEEHVGPITEVEVINQGGFLSTEFRLAQALPPIVPPNQFFFVRGSYTDRSESKTIQLAETFAKN